VETNQASADWIEIINGNPDQRVFEAILRMGTDEMIPRYSNAYDKSFIVRFHDRCDWKIGFTTDRKRGLIWHTETLELA
jgi:hypothetical protein